ncbi:maleylpyruvate isomerase N-terminal domain-containing protein [Streptomyces montanisoli]|uniref:Maleylpyruvate isomerase N-terminal domain-containing protein n=1 Tax=Streptomyces montanisoli TaxID=2798581 RepID=A0A940MIG6_9ACTN|nr:maleylpyruvate isomerase N-terminal domain-containing protein [Streptomyces montanisoli]MBP0461672.1 maleylpyruvate isomerase N-terminal domain-containing protein [Streptomyces montanisoli]
MPVLTHERYCDEITRQTSALCALLDGADLSAPVPTCPDWTTGRLVRHTGGALRWAGHIVAERARHNPPDDEVPEGDGPEGPEGSEDARDLAAWLAGGATVVTDALRAAGPDVPVWTWGWDHSTAFWARRMCHEVLVHRADVALAVAGGLDSYRPDADVAADALDEWLRIIEFAVTEEHAPVPEGLAGTIHLHATDAPGAEWLLEVGGQGFSWRRAHEKADVALRAPLTGLLLASLRRLPVDGKDFEVLGDRGLLDAWLETARFD